MKTAGQKTGKRGEDEACSFLVARGHMILERNWRGGHTEIDIITMDAAGVHFVEVKTRSVPCVADPQDNVNYAKQRHLVQAAGRYLSSCHEFRDAEIFFDVVSVLIYPDGHAELEYIPQAFIPMYV